MLTTSHVAFNDSVRTRPCMDIAPDFVKYSAGLVHEVMLRTKHLTSKRNQSSSALWCRTNRVAQRTKSVNNKNVDVIRSLIVANHQHVTLITNMRSEPENIYSKRTEQELISKYSRIMSKMNVQNGNQLATLMRRWSDVQDNEYSSGVLHCGTYHEFLRFR